MTYRRFALSLILFAALVVGAAAVLVACLAHTAETAPAAGAGASGDTARLAPTERASSAGTPLRDLAARRGLRLGSAANTNVIADDPRYAATLAREFSSITAESVMKWGAVEPSPGAYDWSTADSLVDFAVKHQQQVYGHALVWHRSLPTWLESATLTDGQYQQLLMTHVTAEASHFRGKVWAWDVVNEALNSDGSLRQTLWTQHVGAGYLADAFRWAHAADPDAVLFLNDYGIEDRNPKSDGLYNLVKSLLAQGVPIGGVGFQTHWDTSPLPAEFAANLRRFTMLGLQVAITEIDVRVPVPATPSALDKQASIYASALRTCLSVKGCVSFTVWGFADGFSWVPQTYPGYGAACLFDPDMTPKPAYAAVAAALRG